MASFISSFLVRLPLIYLVVFVLRLDVTYIWWVTALQYFVTSIIMVGRYRRTQWQQLAHKPSYAAETLS